MLCESSVPGIGSSAHASRRMMAVGKYTTPRRERFLCTRCESGDHSVNHQLHFGCLETTAPPPGDYICRCTSKKLLAADKQSTNPWRRRWSNKVGA